MLKELRDEIDSVIAKQNKCCSIDCSHCCYQTIETLDIEVESLKSAINILDARVKEKIYHNLEEYWSFFNKHTPNNLELEPEHIFTNFQNLPKTEKAKCPLLIDKRCSIYNNRPLVCRMHIVESSPELCCEDPYRDSSAISNSLRLQVVEFLKRDKKIELKPLPYIVSEIIDPKRKLKPLMKIEI